MTRYVGAIRHQLARKLQQALRDEGIDFVDFSGENLIPVSGYWLSQDVYRWESVGLMWIFPETGKRMNMSICGWQTMTVCARAKGLVLSAPHVPYLFEADPV